MLVCSNLTHLRAFIQMSFHRAFCVQRYSCCAPFHSDFDPWRFVQQLLHAVIDLMLFFRTGHTHIRDCCSYVLPFVLNVTDLLASATRWPINVAGEWKIYGDSR